MALQYQQHRCRPGISNKNRPSGRIFVEQILYGKRVDAIILSVRGLTFPRFWLRITARLGQNKNSRNEHKYKNKSMWKKIFAASAAAVGIAGLLGAGDAFAAVTTDSYAPGQEISLIATEYNVCVHKDGGYAGDLIIADIRGTNYEKQIVFGDTTDDERCTPVGGIPADGKLKYVTPMGLSDMAYVQSEGGANNRVELNLNDSTMLSKYLRSYGQSTARVGKKVATISFDANGGTGTLPVIADATIGSNVTLPKSTLVRDGYRFVGWNTKADGTGTPYADEATITVGEPGQIQLFAQWVVATTTLDTGGKVNAAIKTLAAGSRVDYASDDTLIKKLEFVDTLPATVNDNTPKVNIALSGEEPVYAYWVANEEEIYINTEADIIYANSDSSNLFRGMKALTSLTLPTSFDTANVTSMGSMFYLMQSLTSLTLPTSFNTANVTNMESMFSGMSALASLTLPTSFDTANVTKMSSMFRDMQALTSLTLPTAFNTSKVTKMSYMFSNMQALTSLTLPASFNTANVTSMDSMFRNMPALTSLTLPASFNTANVTNMSSMFVGVSTLTSLTLPTSFNTANVTNMSSMFYDMQALTSLTLPTSFNTANVTNMYYMFSDMRALTSLTLPTSFNTANVTNMSGMFNGMSALTSLTLPTSFDTSNVTKMDFMFSYMTALTSLTLPELFNTAKVTDMSYMFYSMQALTSLTLPTSFNTANVTNMRSMFSGMSALTSLTLPDTFVVNSGTRTTSIFTSVKNTAKLYATDSTIRTLWPGVFGN